MRDNQTARDLSPNGQFVAFQAGGIQLLDRSKGQVTVVLNIGTAGGTMAGQPSVADNGSLVTPAGAIVHTSMTSAERLTLDTTNDRLFIANDGTNSVLTYNNISTRNGVVTPDRIMTSSSSLTHHLALDLGAAFSI